MKGEIGTTTTNTERWGGKKTRFKEGELSRKREREAFSEDFGVTFKSGMVLVTE